MKKERFPGLAKVTDVWMRCAVHPGGFTLLEILMAIAVAGIIFSAVLSVYTTTLGVSEQIDSQSGQDQTARLVLEQLQRDLEGLYYGSGKGENLSGPYEFSGGRNLPSEDTATKGEVLLEFGTTCLLDFKEDFPRHCRARVRYVLRESDPFSETHVLLREQEVFPELRTDREEAVREIVELADCVQELRFSFNDGEGLTRDSWRTGQGGAGADLPASMGVYFRLEDESGKGRSYRTSFSIPGGGDDAD